MSLQEDRVVVVTGASRGAGKGIALALGATGATVYVTGRSQQEGDAPLPGTVYATAEEITRLGGKGVAVVCDHGDYEQVKALFERIDQEQGRLDILINNALLVPDGLTMTGPFWEKPLALQDILNVGLRSSYVSSYFAAPLLLKMVRGWWSILHLLVVAVICTVRPTEPARRLSTRWLMIWPMIFGPIISRLSPSGWA